MCAFAALFAWHLSAKWKLPHHSRRVPSLSRSRIGGSLPPHSNLWDVVLSLTVFFAEPILRASVSCVNRVKSRFGLTSRTHRAEQLLLPIPPDHTLFFEAKSTLTIAPSCRRRRWLSTNIGLYPHPGQRPTTIGQQRHYQHSNSSPPRVLRLRRAAPAVWYVLRATSISFRC